MTTDTIKIGLVSISDRASAGIYKDKGLPELENWLSQTILNPCEFSKYLIADEQPQIEQVLIDLVDNQQCNLILTTGGTGPALRDVTPDATLAIADRIMPGFGEQMRQISLAFVPTAILSRQVGVIRKKTLILNLPGQPKAIKETLAGIKNDLGEVVVNGIFASIPYCIDLLGGPYLETDENIIQAFRPKSAIR
ncbi:molybdopterin adenylyltransferase [Utexia brackfieldae]|uniref:molybdopterin adenylyltransferase n=1 Tax=Utexia brackfieldae TaxID=3074108 RepID=UPI00370DCD4D